MGTLSSGDLPVATARFDTTPFAVTEAPTTRTLADRLAEIKNVKDFGATGNGTTDDTSAIQAAIDWTSNAARGTIYFPPGDYLVSAPITFNYNGGLSIRFCGELNLSRILGSVSGFILDRSLSPSDSPTSGERVIENLTISNSHAAGGGIRMGSTVGGAIRNCMVSAWQGIWVSDSDGGASQSVVVEGNVISTGGLGGLSNGIQATGNAIIAANDINGFDVGIRVAATSGVVIEANRIEQCRTGIYLGQDASGGVTGCDGVVILGGTMESCGTAIRNGAGEFSFNGFAIQGFEGAAPYEYTVVSPAVTVTGSVSGATASATITADGILTMGTVTGTFIPKYNGNVQNGSGPWDFLSGSGVPTGTFLNQQNSGTLGKAGSYQCTGSPQYGVRYIGDGAAGGVTNGVQVSGQFKIACFKVEDSTNRGCMVFQGCRAANASILGGATWSLPTKAHVADWINCDVNPTYLFGNLPTGGNLREGDEYNITNSNTATWGATAAGSGSNHVKVRYNGTNWTVVGK